MRNAIIIMVFVLALIASFLVTSGLLWVVCWAFGMTFSWKISVGVWVVYLVISNMFKSK